MQRTSYKYISSCRVVPKCHEITRCVIRNSATHGNSGITLLFFSLACLGRLRKNVCVAPPSCRVVAETLSFPLPCRSSLPFTLLSNYPPPSFLTFLSSFSPALVKFPRFPSLWEEEGRKAALKQRNMCLKLTSELRNCLSEREDGRIRKGMKSMGKKR